MEVIKFNKKIYSLEAVKKAIEEFKSLAEFKIKDLDKYIEVEIDKIDNEYKGILKDEFSNYVLGLMS
ncbi:MAG: HxsD-like protein [Candidatus Parcubacteria bacterium]|nr:HxsD-like protein [Candidatus Parcubacteria bacterium]